jgi:two-component system response regulator FlrC
MVVSQTYPWGRREVVLVVDDDVDLREALCQQLLDAGYEPVQAMDGQDALEVLLRDRRPSLIVLDLRMPQRSGWALLEILRQSVTLVDIPVVVLSAYLAFPPAGAIAWLKKPLVPEVFLEVVRRHALAPGP